MLLPRLQPARALPLVHLRAFRLTLTSLLPLIESQLPEFFLSVSPEETRVRGTRVRERYAAVKAALKSHLLAAVCQLK